MRLSRPLYEGLPWVYIGAGAGALGASYFLEDASAVTLSLLTGIAGLAAVLGGVVVLLRRRDYRELRSQYGEVDNVSSDDRKPEGP